MVAANPIPETTKAVGESERFTFSFDKSLGSAEVVSSAEMIGNPDQGLTLGTTAISGDGRSVQSTISGGRAGEKYVVTCRATTDVGQIIDNSICIHIVHEKCAT